MRIEKIKIGDLITYDGARGDYKYAIVRVVEKGMYWGYWRGTKEEAIKVSVERWFEKICGTKEFDWGAGDSWLEVRNPIKVNFD